MALKYKPSNKCVIDLSTNQVYPSVKEAAAKLGVSTSTISSHCNNKVKKPRFAFSTEGYFISVRTMEEMNNILENLPTKLLLSSLEVRELDVTQRLLYTNCSTWEIKEHMFYLYCGGSLYGNRYCFNLSGNEELTQLVGGYDVYRAMNKEYLVPDLRKDEWFKERLLYLESSDKFKLGINPILGFNPKLTNQEIYSYEYDLNSAYAAALVQPIPDTTSYETWKTVGPRQIGFSISEEEELIIREEGSFAEFVFDLIESPFQNFVSHWYNIKSNPSTPDEKKLAKNYLTYGIGYLQKRNPFIRAIVMWRCNSIIEKLIDENSILWNTDAIYSTKPIPTLTLGTGLGEWKLVEGPIRYKNLEYQVVGEKPHYRGIPRAKFSEDFNLLTDELPEPGSLYYYNKEDQRICLSKTKN